MAQSTTTRPAMVPLTKAAAFDSLARRVMALEVSDHIRGFLLSYPIYLTKENDLVNLWCEQYAKAVEKEKLSVSRLVLKKSYTTRMLDFLRLWIDDFPQDLSPKLQAQLLKTITDNNIDDSQTSHTQMVNEFKLLFLKSRALKPPKIKKKKKKSSMRAASKPNRDNLNSAHSNTIESSHSKHKGAGSMRAPSRTMQRSQTSTSLKDSSPLSESSLPRRNTLRGNRPLSDSTVCASNSAAFLDMGPAENDDGDFTSSRYRRKDDDDDDGESGGSTTEDGASEDEFSSMPVPIKLASSHKSLSPKSPNRLFKRHTAETISARSNIHSYRERERDDGGEMHIPDGKWKRKAHVDAAEGSDMDKLLAAVQREKHKLEEVGSNSSSSPATTPRSSAELMLTNNDKHASLKQKMMMQASMMLKFGSRDASMTSPRGVQSSRTPYQNYAQTIVISELSASTIARELTHIEFEMYSKILPREFLNQAWQSEEEGPSSGDSEEGDSQKLQAPHITKMIQHFNDISYWVATEILTSQGKEQVKTARKFISIARECASMGNYNSTMEILSGLQNGAVSRLKVLWSKIGDTLLARFKELEELMDPRHNFASYREAIKKRITSGESTLPYMPLYLGYFTFLEEGNELYDADGVINLFLVELRWKQVVDVLQFQKIPYEHQSSNPAIADALKNVTFIDDDDTLYAISQSSQPSAASSPVNSPRMRNLNSSMPTPSLSSSMPNLSSIPGTIRRPKSLRQEVLEQNQIPSIEFNLSRARSEEIVSNSTPTTSRISQENVITDGSSQQIRETSSCGDISESPLRRPHLRGHRRIISVNHDLVRREIADKIEKNEAIDEHALDIVDPQSDSTLSTKPTPAVAPIAEKTSHITRPPSPPQINNKPDIPELYLHDLDWTTASPPDHLGFEDSLSGSLIPPLSPHRNKTGFSSTQRTGADALWDITSTSPPKATYFPPEKEPASPPLLKPGATLNVRTFSSKTRTSLFGASGDFPRGRTLERPKSALRVVDDVMRRLLEANLTPDGAESQAETSSQKTSTALQPTQEPSSDVNTTTVTSPTATASTSAKQQPSSDNGVDKVAIPDWEERLRNSGSLKLRYSKDLQGRGTIIFFKHLATGAASVNTLEFGGGEEENDCKASE